MSDLNSEHKEKPDRKGRSGRASKLNRGRSVPQPLRKIYISGRKLSLASRPATYPGIHISGIKVANEPPEVRAKPDRELAMPRSRSVMGKLQLLLVPSAVAKGIVLL
jgi:hypothetical protein